MLPHLPKHPETEPEWFHALANLARYLRTEEGCPWDREQRAIDFAKFMEEEAQEYREALDSGSASDAEEEFGDCLFTLLASAAAAEEQGVFRIEKALARSHEKMVRRHDHVFGAEKARTPEEAIEAWNRIKAEEKRARDEN